MNALKTVICALMLVLLVGCMGVTNNPEPAETTTGDDAQLEGVNQPQNTETDTKQPVQEEQTTVQKEHMFDKTIDMLKAKTVFYEDNTGNSYELADDILTVRIGDTTFLKTDFAMNTVVLDLNSKTAVGSCDEQAIRNYVDDLCARNTEENMDLSFDDYFVKTPIMWLEDYRNHEITRTQKDVIYQESVTTLLSFDDGTKMWLNYKGIPLKVLQGDNLVSFFDVKTA